MSAQPPLTDGILFALARLVDDSQVERREPSHADIEYCIDQSGLCAGDPNRGTGRPIGKEKRVRAVLTWAIENDYSGGQSMVSRLVQFIRSRGGFRPDSPNYVGSEPIRNVQLEFEKEGFDLSNEGELRAKVLDLLSGRELTEALEAYVRRAQRGSEDAALLTGTGKDLLEAVARHVLLELSNISNPPGNFPTLLGQAFIALGLKTSSDKLVPGEPPQHRMQRGLFEAALAVNTLRNREGTGHGRPWLPSVTQNESLQSVYVMGLVAQMMLQALRTSKALSDSRTIGPFGCSK